MPSHSAERHSHDPYAHAADAEVNNHFKNAQARQVRMDLAETDDCTVLQVSVAGNCVCIMYQLQGGGSEVQDAWVQMPHWTTKHRTIVYLVPRPQVPSDTFRGRFETQQGYRRIYVGGLPAEPYGPASDVVCALRLARGIRAIGVAWGHVDSSPDRPMVGNITVMSKGGNPRAAFVWLAEELYNNPGVCSDLMQSEYVDTPDGHPVKLNVEESHSNVQAQQFLC